MNQVRKEWGRHGTSHVALIRKADAFPEPPVAFLCSGLGRVAAPSWEGEDFQSLGGSVGSDSGQTASPRATSGNCIKFL